MLQNEKRRWMAELLKFQSGALAGRDTDNGPCGRNVVDVPSAPRRLLPVSACSASLWILVPNAGKGVIWGLRLV